MALEIAKTNEAQLIAQAQRGDVKSFSELVEAYQARAIRTAYSIIGNMEDARDIAQEAFVKAFERLEFFKAESRFYTWFYRILVNGCKDFLRKRKVRGFVLLCIGRPKDTDGEEPALDVADPAKTARQNLLDDEMSAQIRRALERLPIQQRTAFSLRYLEGLSIEDVAESMGLSAGAVKAHLWQGGQKLKNFLKDYVVKEEDHS